MNKRTFTERFAAPTSFIFKNQVWDTALATGAASRKQCDFCSRHIRYAFILKQIQTDDPLISPEIHKWEIGACCFSYFKRWNPDLYYPLTNALRTPAIGMNAGLKNYRNN